MQRFAYFRWDLLEEDDFGDAEVVVFCATRGGCDGESDFGERGIAVVVGDMHDFCGIGEPLPGEAVGRGGAETTMQIYTFFLIHSPLHENYSLEHILSLIYHELIHGNSCFFRRKEKILFPITGGMSFALIKQMTDFYQGLSEAVVSAKRNATQIARNPTQTGMGS